MPLRGAALGVAMAIVGNFMFTTSDAIVKSLSGRYSIFQIIAMQVPFACIPLFIMLRREGTLAHLRIRHPILVFLRGLMAGLGTIFGFYAFSVLPLADVYSIAFCAPLVVTLASIPILGEQVGIRRFTAVIVGFLGVLVMVQPGFVRLSLGHLSAFCSVFTGASVVLIMRRIGREEDRGVMVSGRDDRPSRGKCPTPRMGWSGATLAGCGSCRLLRSDHGLGSVRQSGSAPTCACGQRGPHAIHDAGLGFDLRRHNLRRSRSD
jgi:drug/metabolite transporter (DMT)-like permease